MWITLVDPSYSEIREIMGDRDFFLQLQLVARDRACPSEQSLKRELFKALIPIEWYQGA